MKEHNRMRLASIILAAAAVVWAATLFIPAKASAWNFAVPAVEVQPQNGVFQFPVSTFEDGKARHFQYTISPTQRVRFFVVKSVDGVLRAALDACDVCFRAKKGYVQQGNDMICINCGLKFRTDRINEVSGGCNPHPLKREIRGGNVIVSQQDVLAGLRFFQ